jgi:glycosyltransferase involved in cell wall biosynthesis
VAGDHMGAVTTRISVIIATRDRSEDLSRCLDSVLACDHDAFEVIVVDQSGEPSPVPPDPRIVHLHTPTQGKSAAVNVGLSHASADLLAFTDDDCTVPPDWLDQVERVFARHPGVGLAFGEMRPTPHDPRDAFVPPVELDEFRIVRGARSGHVRGGGGGNMAALRSVLDNIGPFDEQLGPGSRFKACEEFDVYYRVLAAGQAVAFVPELSTTHWGIRSYADGSGQMLKRWYAYGEGAVIGKHLRLGDHRMGFVAVRIAGEYLRVVAGNIRSRRFTGLGPLAYWWRGLVEAAATRVDRRGRLFAQTAGCGRHQRPSRSTG